MVEPPPESPPRPSNATPFPPATSMGMLAAAAVAAAEARSAREHTAIVHSVKIETERKTVLFCSALFCSVRFGSVLFCSVLFCSVLFCSVLFCSVLFVRFEREVVECVWWCLGGRGVGKMMEVEPGAAILGMAPLVAPPPLATPPLPPVELLPPNNTIYIQVGVSLRVCWCVFCLSVRPSAAAVFEKQPYPWRQSPHR